MCTQLCISHLCQSFLKIQLDFSEAQTKCLQTHFTAHSFASSTELPHPLILLYLHRTDAVGFLFFFSYCISICMKSVILKYLNWHRIWISVYGLHFES